MTGLDLLNYLKSLTEDELKATVSIYGAYEDDFFEIERVSVKRLIVSRRKNPMSGGHYALIESETGKPTIVIE